MSLSTGGLLSLVVSACPQATAPTRGCGNEEAEGTALRDKETMKEIAERLDKRRCHVGSVVARLPARVLEPLEEHPVREVQPHHVVVRQ